MQEREKIQAWLRSVLELKGWKPNRWAIEARVSPTTVTRILNDKKGTASLPSYGTLQKLAAAAHVPGPLESVKKEVVINEMSIVNSPQENRPPSVETQMVPLISWASAGHPMLAWEDEITDDTPRVSVDLHGDHVLATRVVGQSMSNVAQDGDVIVYDYSDKVALDRKYYLILVHGDLSFRQYRDTGGPPRFEADSNMRKYDAIYPSIEVQVEIVGRVHRALKNL